MKQQAYTDEFRREAVRRADEPGVTAKQVARDLGINVNLIYNWRSQFKKINTLRAGERVRHQFHETRGVDYSKAEFDEIRKLKRENAELKEELEFLKKSDGVLRESKKVRYAYIESNRGKYAVVHMCRWLGVSRSGYYRSRTREPGPRARQRERAAVNDTYYALKQRYGAPRIVVELNESGISCSRNHVAELLREQGLRARNGKRFKFQPAPEAISQVSGNLLKRDFRASRPNEKWVSDISVPQQAA